MFNIFKPQLSAKELAEKYIQWFCSQSMEFTIWLQDSPLFDRENDESAIQKIEEGDFLLLSLSGLSISASKLEPAVKLALSYNVLTMACQSMNTQYVDDCTDTIMDAVDAYKEVVSNNRNVAGVIDTAKLFLRRIDISPEKHPVECAELTRRIQQFLTLSTLTLNSFGDNFRITDK